MEFWQWKGRPSGVGQKTTTFKAGTLFSKYIPSLKCASRESSFPTQPFPDDVETKDSDIQPHDLQDATSFVFSDDSEQVQDYDTDCNVSDWDLRCDEDELTKRFFSLANRQVKVERWELSGHRFEQCLV